MLTSRSIVSPIHYSQAHGLAEKSFPAYFFKKLEEVVKQARSGVVPKVQLNKANLRRMAGVTPGHTPRSNRSSRSDGSRPGTASSWGSHERRRALLDKALQEARKRSEAAKSKGERTARSVRPLTRRTLEAFGVTIEKQKGLVAALN